MDNGPHIHPPAPIDVTSHFPELLDGLISLLTELTEEEWNAPTVCPGWTVKDVALHLLGVDLGNLSLRRDGFNDPWWQTSSDNTSTALSHYNENWVLAARRISPRLLCELLNFTGDAAARYYASLDMAAIGGPVSWAGPQPAPVWLDVAREYTERWVHQQQIRDVVRRPGFKEPRYLAPVLAAFAHALPHALRNVAALADTAVRLRVTGEAGGQWMAIRVQNRWLLAQDTGQVPAAAATLDQDVAWRLWTRGMSREDAEWRVQIEGDPRLAGAVLEMVSIIA